MFWINTPLMDAHLYAKQQLSLSTFSVCRRKKPEPGPAFKPVFMCAAVSTPGLRDGNWTRKAKTLGGVWGGASRNHATVEKKDCSK